jgi:glycosyltransferase involved in cell wall biosynthesis
MAEPDVDVLMITYNRAAYTAKSLQALLDTDYDNMRVWLWHNGNHEETLETVKSFLSHPKIHEFHHSPENVKLNKPTNWLWRNAKGSFVGKVDDDCRVSPEWMKVYVDFHQIEPTLGAIASWHFQESDFDMSLAKPKLAEYPGGHQLLRNCWINGSGYIMKHDCINDMGYLGEGQSFSNYCLRAYQKGWLFGWRYPLVLVDHMDEPSSEHTLLKSDADIKQWLPLSAYNNGVKTIEQWNAQLRKSARTIQTASLDIRHHFGWQTRLVHAKFRVLRLFGIRRLWL